MGERAKNIGEEAENKVWHFLDSLAYEIQDTNVEYYDIDCIAESPPEKPNVGLAKPCYSPNGLVAFEVKESSFSRKKVEAFKKKIKKYNSENSSQLNGGVYLVDRRISSEISQYMRRRRIWGWDVRRQRLYREKANAFHYWSSKKAFTTEIQIDKCTSYLRISTPPPTRFKQLLHFSVFFDDTFHKLSPRTVKQVMNKIRSKSMSPLIDLGIRPMKVYFEFFSIGGLSRHLLEETYKNVIEPWKDEEITVHIKKKPFTDFRAFSTL